MISDHAQLVWKVLSGIPIEVYDDDTSDLWHMDLWELVLPRPEGDYAGSRIIGSANMVTAFNLLHLKLITADTNTDTLEEFRVILQELSESKLIRKRPERVRETFKSV